MKHPNAKWLFGNGVLYEMCDEYPKHDDADTIVGKLWLIGRSYSAALERRRTGDQLDSDTFYYDVVAPKMKEIGADLDARISEIKRYPIVTSENLSEILKVHKFLTDAFDSITQMEKRSLASKYLHFHQPNLFYLYDTRASQGINKLVQLTNKRLFVDADQEYSAFCQRCLEFQKFVERKFNRVLTPREIDDFLLYG